MNRLLRIFFHQLYHRFAWVYDMVAWCVSLGRWNDWCRAIIPLLPPGRVLEIGSGPGHLQHQLALLGKEVYALDESWQMNTQAAHRYPGLCFLRARAENAPFASATFSAIAATFPAPYLFEPTTAAELARILTPNGQLIAILAARPAGQTLQDRLIRTLFRITGETPPANFDYSHLLTAYNHAGFQSTATWESHPSADLLIMRCHKSIFTTQTSDNIANTTRKKV